MTPVVPAKKRGKFDSKRFLSTINGGRKIAAFGKKQTIFAQGDSSDAIFYIQKGNPAATRIVARMDELFAVDAESRRKARSKEHSPGIAGQRAK